MSEEAAAKEFAQEIKTIGDQLSKLTLKEAVDLAGYLKQSYGIEAAAGGGMMIDGGVPRSFIFRFSVR